MAEPAAKLNVEVAYARPECQKVIVLMLAAGATVTEAIQQSGIMCDFPEIDLASAKVGIFGKRVRLDTMLQSGDRVEIYRPLLADPKDRRRKRAAAKSPSRPS